MAYKIIYHSVLCELPLYWGKLDYVSKDCEMVSFLFLIKLVLKNPYFFLQTIIIHFVLLTSENKILIFVSFKNFDKLQISLYFSIIDTDTCYV